MATHSGNWNGENFSAESTNEPLNTAAEGFKFGKPEKNSFSRGQNIENVTKR